MGAASGRARAAVPAQVAHRRAAGDQPDPAERRPRAESTWVRCAAKGGKPRRGAGGRRTRRPPGRRTLVIPKPAGRHNPGMRCPTAATP